MKLYRFLARSFHDGSIIEAGETRLLADDNLSGPHIVDVAAESEAAERGETYVPGQPSRRPDVVFRADLADNASMAVSELVPMAAAEPTAADPAPSEPPPAGG